MSDEIWAEIPGYPNYVISDRGRILNKKLNRIYKGTTEGGRTVVSIQSPEGLPHKYTIEGLMSMVNFNASTESVGVRKIKIVETGQVFDTPAGVARALLSDVSSVYKALKGTRKTLSGVSLEYVYD